MATTFPPGLTGVFGTSLACYYCLSLLSITQITTMLIHMHGPMQLLIGCWVLQCPCQSLFAAVTGDCSRLAHCRASFSWCKSAHVGHGDKYGPVGLELKQEKRAPMGLIVVYFGTQHITLLCIKCQFNNEMWNTLCRLGRAGKIRQERRGGIE